MSHPSDGQTKATSQSYKLPALDESFLLGESMRGVRFLLEYAKADEILRNWNILSTIVVFGSARIHPDGGDPGARWYRMARDFGRIASAHGGALEGDHHARHNVIATGGGPGIMEAANRGASEAGAPSIGFNITLPQEQAPNPYTTPELTFQFHYFAMRKMHLAMRASALVIFPGGFGTLDEMFEILTLRQTGKMPDIPIVVMDKTYWSSVISFDALVAHGTVDRKDLGLFSFADDAMDAWGQLDAAGIGSDVYADERE